MVNKITDWSAFLDVLTSGVPWTLIGLPELFVWGDAKSCIMLECRKEIIAYLNHVHVIVEIYPKYTDLLLVKQLLVLFAANDQKYSNSHRVITLWLRDPSGRNAIGTVESSFVRWKSIVPETDAAILCNTALEYKWIIRHGNPIWNDSCSLCASHSSSLSGTSSSSLSSTSSS